MKALKFIAPFLTSHLHRDPSSVHSALRGMSYGQAAIAFTVFMDDTSDQSHFMAAFAFIFPIFIAMGATFGAMAQQESKNGSLLVAATLVFILLTSLHSLFLFIHFFSFNKLAALMFALSFIAIFNIFGFAAKLYGEISQQEKTTEQP
jgi:predicted Kef-type K+ transport protein